MSGDRTITGDAVADLFGDEVFVLSHRGDTAEMAAMACMNAMINRFGLKAAKDAMRGELKRKRVTSGQARNLMMLAFHDTLKEGGAKDPTRLTADMFSGDGPLGNGVQRSAVERQIRPSRRKKSPKG